MIYDLVDKIYTPTGAMLAGEDGIEYPEMVALDGYFVAVISIKKEVDINGNIVPNRVLPYIVTMDTPQRKFACDAETIHLKFTNRDEWLSLGIEHIEGSDIYYEESNIEVTKVVTMRQARLALLQSGLLAAIESAIQNGTDEAMKIEWEYATELRRDWASLITLIEALNITSEQLDELFALADTL